MSESELLGLYLVLVTSDFRLPTLRNSLKFLFLLELKYFQGDIEPRERRTFVFELPMKSFQNRGQKVISNSSAEIVGDLHAQE